MATLELVTNILNSYLPPELVKKIIYEHKAFQTPSCKLIKELITTIKSKNENINDIIFISPEIQCFFAGYVYKVWSDWGSSCGFRICYTQDNMHLKITQCKLYKLDYH
jgi:hypothetical protein